MNSSGKFRSCSEIVRDVVVKQLQQIPNLICLDSDTGLYNELTSEAPRTDSSTWVSPSKR